jgi:murein DD-endopeptidase MepM/ murein hydrolase activator NlpD
VDRRRYSPHGRFGALATAKRESGLPQLYRGRAASAFKDLYETDHAEGRQGGRFRWLISTCLAGTVGAISILVVIYGSADKRESRGGFLPGLTELGGEANLAGRDIPFLRNSDGLKWATPKGDRLKITSGSVTVRYLVNESVKQRRLGRDYIHAKPYARIVARLAPVPPDYLAKVPPFNPLNLYATQTVNPGEDSESETTTQGNVSVNVIELLGGILPDEDHQELDDAEIALHVDAAREAETEAERIRAGAEADANRGAGEDTPLGAEGTDTAAPNTTVLVKPVQAEEDTLADLEGRETQVVRVGEGDTLRGILTRVGADSWQVRGMIEAARNLFPESSLAAGQEVRITLVPSLTRRDKKEPARFSVFSDGHDHLVTVTRNAAGEFVASKSSSIAEEIANAGLDDNDRASTSSVYASVYYAGLLQHLPEDVITKMMKIHASQTDFRRRLRPGDMVEFFFDMKDEAKKADSPPGELLYTAITSGGETYRFYRFRTPDGVVDYYDEKGNNSKQFLMRRPVRGDVRLASGFGMRFHPLLNERRMHTGVDWATSPGTPILAAGTGVVEEAGRKGQYGNYVRIRHPNGYHTAYGHMLRFRKGIVAGAKVRQGEIIGYVGSTGLASGPHLHYEVLINSRFVDPLAIQVPRERELAGRQLAEFQKERQRIDDLRHLAPVMTASK